MSSKILATVLLASLLSSTLAAARMHQQHSRSRVNHADLPHVAGWLTGWGGAKHQDLYKLYDELSFAFAVTDPSPDIGINMTIAEVPQAPLTEVKAVDEVSKKRLLSIGGWAGSQFFSEHVRDEAKMKIFAKQVTDVVVANGFAGVDLDWEFPNGKPDNPSHVTGDRGASCNAHHPQDYNNLVKFIRILRVALTTAMGKNPIMTAAVPFSGFLDENQQQLKDAKALVADDALDFIAIMSYEIGHNYRHWTGLHAPLEIPNNAPRDQNWSIAKSVDYWIKAGIPADRIQMGLAAYGKLLYTTVKGDNIKALPERPEFDNSRVYQPQNYPTVQMTAPNGWDPTVPWGTGIKRLWELDFCGVFRCLNGGNGAIPYWNLTTTEKLLDANGKAIPGDDLIIEYDKKAESPYIYNRKTGAFYTYDNPTSFEAKSMWAKKKGLLGVKIWSIQHDTLDGALIKAARKPWYG